MIVPIVVGFLLAAATAENSVLGTLRHEHPRLIALPDDVGRVGAILADNTQAAAIYDRLKREADRLLEAPTLKRQLVRRSGPTMLDTSRKCVDRIYTLATVYRLGNERRYADRAIKELLAVSDFSDWNPAIFLDTAEMTHAAGIGYDWLFEAISPDDRRRIRQAIVEKGLRAGETAYRKGSSWTRAAHNWNIVCNGGMIIGALAVAEDEPQLADTIVHSALTSLPAAMKEYSPDGGWAEGPGYWNYATRYAEKSAMLYWLARKFDRPTYAWYQREYVSGASPLDLWWFSSAGTKPADLPTDRWFRHTDVVLMRSGWHDPRAVFVGFKGGDNTAANHGHLDLGTFVLDADGQRWVRAPGGDSYSLPGYFGAQRWTYYRTNTHGQNAILIDGKDQAPKAVAPVVAFYSTPDHAHAVVDLSAAYASQAAHVRRGIGLLRRREVLLQDEIEGLCGSELTWQIHTEASIELHAREAVLSQKGERLVARILEPRDAHFSVEAVALPPPQRAMPGVQRLTIKLKSRVELLRLAVLFVPGNAPTPPHASTPLENGAVGQAAR